MEAQLRASQTIDACNLVLRAAGLSSRVATLQECQLVCAGTDALVAATEAALQRCLPGIIHTPSTAAEQAHNLDTAIAGLAVHLGNDLSHICGTQLTSGSLTDMADLLQILAALSTDPGRANPPTSETTPHNTLPTTADRSQHTAPSGIQHTAPSGIQHTAQPSQSPRATQQPHPGYTMQPPYHHTAATPWPQVPCCGLLNSLTSAHATLPGASVPPTAVAGVNIRAAPAVAVWAIPGVPVSAGCAVPYLAPSFPVLSTTQYSMQHTAQPGTYAALTCQTDICPNPTDPTVLRAALMGHTQQAPAAKPQSDSQHATRESWSAHPGYNRHSGSMVHSERNKARHHAHPVTTPASADNTPSPSRSATGNQRRGSSVRRTASTAHQASGARLPSSTAGTPRDTLSGVSSPGTSAPPSRRVTQQSSSTCARPSAHSSLTSRRATAAGPSPLSRGARAYVSAGADSASSPPRQSGSQQSGRTPAAAHPAVPRDIAGAAGGASKHHNRGFDRLSREFGTGVGVRSRPAQNGALGYVTTLLRQVAAAPVGGGDMVNGVFRTPAVVKRVRAKRKHKRAAPAATPCDSPAKVCRADKVSVGLQPAAKAGAEDSCKASYSAHGVGVRLAAEDSSVWLTRQTAELEDEIESLQARLDDYLRQEGSMAGEAAAPEQTTGVRGGEARAGPEHQGLDPRKEGGLRQWAPCHGTGHGRDGQPWSIGVGSAGLSDGEGRVGKISGTDQHAESQYGQQETSWDSREGMVPDRGAGGVASDGCLDGVWEAEGPCIMGRSRLRAGTRRRGQAKPAARPCAGHQQTAAQRVFASRSRTHARVCRSSVGRLSGRGVRVQPACAVRAVPQVHVTQDMRRAFRCIGRSSQSTKDKPVMRLNRVLAARLQHLDRLAHDDSALAHAQARRAARVRKHDRQRLLLRMDILLRQLAAEERRDEAAAARQCKNTLRAQAFEERRAATRRRRLEGDLFAEERAECVRNAVRQEAQLTRAFTQALDMEKERLLHERTLGRGVPLLGLRKYCQQFKLAHDQYEAMLRVVSDIGAQERRRRLQAEMNMRFAQTEELRTTRSHERQRVEDVLSRLNTEQRAAHVRALWRMQQDHDEQLLRRLRDVEDM